MGLLVIVFGRARQYRYANFLRLAGAASLRRGG